MPTAPRANFHLTSLHRAEPTAPSSPPGHPPTMPSSLPSVGRRPSSIPGIRVPLLALNSMLSSPAPSGPPVVGLHPKHSPPEFLPLPDQLPPPGARPPRLAQQRSLPGPIVWLQLHQLFAVRSCRLPRRPVRSPLLLPFSSCRPSTSCPAALPVVGLHPGIDPGQQRAQQHHERVGGAQLRFTDRCTGVGGAAAS